MSNRILRRNAVLDRTGLSVSTLYYFINEGRFPKPVKLGLRSVGWFERDIEDWIVNLSKHGGVCDD